MNTNNDKRTVSVIGVGLPRTGTLSLKHALEKLLPGKCYHMVETFNHQNEWTKFCDGQMSDEEFTDLFISNGFTAAVDVPVSVTYKTALRVFPDAKFVLTHREPRSWMESMLKTIIVIQLSYKSFPFVIFHWMRAVTKYLPINTIMLWNIDKIDTFKDMIDSCLKGTGVEFFNKWTEDVKNTIPKDKLLVYKVGDGWEPLCTFLNVPVPDEPFPNINSVSEFQQRFQDKRNEGLKVVFQIFIAILLVTISYFWMM